MADTTLPGAPAMTADQELAQLKADPTYAGGQFYGRTPGGLADLQNGGAVADSAAYGSNTMKQSPADVANTISNSPVRRYTGSSTTVGTTPGQSAVDTYTGADGGAPKQPDVNAIREGAMNDVQAEISSTKNAFASLIENAKQEGVSNLGKGRAVDARGGILGSDFGNAHLTTIQKGTDTKVEALNSQMNAAIGAVMSKAQARGDALVQLAQNESDKKSAAYVDSLKQHTLDARTELLSLPKAGVPLSSLSQDEYNKLIEQTGYTPSVFNAVYNAALPSHQQIKYTYEKLADGTILPVYTDPTTGQPKAGAPLTPPKSSTGDTYDGFMVAPDGTPIFYNKTTGKAQVAEVAGANHQNFSKPQTGTKPTVAQVKADKMGKSWLQNQPNFTAADLDKYNTDPVFHEKVNNSAAASAKVKTSSSGGRSI